MLSLVVRESTRVVIAGRVAALEVVQLDDGLKESSITLSPLTVAVGLE